MKKVLIGLSVLCACFSVAQNNDVKGSSFGFQLEHVDLQKGQLNTYLDTKGLDKGEMPSILYGLNWGFKFGQHVLNIDFTTNKTVQQESQFTVTNKLTSFAVGYGYSLLKKDHLDIFPYLGFKTLIYSYRYLGYAGLTDDFDEYLTQNKSYVDLENRMYAADLGLGFSYINTFAFSLRVGTQLPFISKNWRDVYSTDKLNNGPDLKSMFYVKACIGFGDLDKNSKVYTPNEGENLDFPWNEK